MVANSPLVKLLWGWGGVKRKGCGELGREWVGGEGMGWDGMGRCEVGRVRWGGLGVDCAHDCRVVSIVFYQHTLLFLYRPRVRAKAEEDNYF